MIKLSEITLKWMFRRLGEFSFVCWDGVLHTEAALEHKQKGLPKYTIRFNRQTKRRKHGVNLDLMFDDDGEYIGLRRPKDIRAAEWRRWELETLAQLIAGGYVEVFPDA